jgi:hypothetical protein
MYPTTPKGWESTRFFAPKKLSRSTRRRQWFHPFFEVAQRVFMASSAGNIPANRALASGSAAVVSADGGNESGFVPRAQTVQPQV